MKKIVLDSELFTLICHYVAREKEIKEKKKEQKRNIVAGINKVTISLFLIMKIGFFRSQKTVFRGIVKFLLSKIKFRIIHRCLTRETIRNGLRTS